MRNDTPTLSDGERDSLVGHVPTVVPLFDDWAQRSIIDRFISERLHERCEQEVAGLDHTVYSHEALRDVYGFALLRATTEDAGTPFPIPWAPQNNQAPDEVRILRGQHQPSQAARANNEVTREQAMERIQQFLNDVLSWAAAVGFGDVARRDALAGARARLMAELNTRIEQNGYLVGAGCSRCAH